MNLVLRKYFWLVYLLSIFLGTVFLGKAVSHIIESFLFFLPITASKQEPVQTSLEPQFSIRQTLERNIFCSFCAICRGQYFLLNGIAPSWPKGQPNKNDDG